MTVVEYVLLVAGLIILGAGVFFVVRGRRAELAAEREATHSLERMARALQELQSELGKRRDEPERPADETEQVRIQIVDDKPSAAGSELERAVQDHEVLQVRLMLNASPVFHSLSARRLSLEWTRTAAQRMLAANHEAGSVVDEWENLTRDASHGPTYIDVMGPTFIDAVTHATKVGIMPHRQADVFQEWAASTRAIERSPRGGKRHESSDSMDSIFVLGSDREAVG